MFILLSTLIACGPKEPPAVAEPVPAPEPVVEAAPEPEPMPEPEPEPVKPPSNVDFNVKLTYSDGTVKEGKVVRLERSSDFNGMKDWYDKESRLTIFGESGSTAKDIEWTDIKTVSVVGNSKDVSCIYDSDWNPWLYVCTMKTTSTLLDKSGQKWTLDSKYKWRLTFDDDSEVELWLQNIHAMEQDEKEVELGMDNNQNHDLYAKLQDSLRAVPYVKKVEVQ